MSGADRPRRWRRNQRRGVKVLDCAVQLHELVRMLIDSGRLSEAEALDRERVERELGRLVADVVARWKDS